MTHITKESLQSWLYLYHVGNALKGQLPITPFSYKCNKTHINGAKSWTVSWSDNSHRPSCLHHSRAIQRTNILLPVVHLIFKMCIKTFYTERIRDTGPRVFIYIDIMEAINIYYTNVDGNKKYMYTNNPSGGELRSR